jgi:DNA repair protein RecN (Recombination protein N)
MLEELRIRGLGVIDDATLPLGPGLTVVTGETGAGKTMVVSGLLLLFGGRADAARVRSGAEQATVDGRLEIAAASAAAERVRDAGGDLDDDSGGRSGLVLRRSVSAAGRSRAHVGGAPTPIAVLGELAEHLLTVHGQSDQLRLARPAEQRAALDRYAGIDLAEFSAAYQAWRAAAAELDERRAHIGELRREADLLSHGLAEIEAAAPLPGEDTDLAAAAGRLAHADALRLAAHRAHDALLGDADDPMADSADVAALLGTARRALDQQAGADPELDQLTARLSELAALAAELGADFGAYEAGLDADPQRLEQIEARRAVLTALVRKYADSAEPDLADVATWAAQATRRLADIDVSDEALAALAARRDELGAEVDRLAADLTALRSAAAEALGALVTAELAGLAMPHATCTITVAPRTAVGPDGADEIEILLQPQADAPALPLSRGASGGELSRVMLAIELCLAGTAPVPTMVFDEVDAGVGGRAALEVGRRLARLAHGNGRPQVIAVTHLAQVAAFADTHVVVDKRSAPSGAGAAVVASDVRVVAGDERRAELARMLAGTDSRTALEHAAELLAAADSAADSTCDPTSDSTSEPDETAAERPLRKPVKSRR